MPHDALKFGTVILTGRLVRKTWVLLNIVFSVYDLDSLIQIPHIFLKRITESEEWEGIVSVFIVNNIWLQNKFLYKMELYAQLFKLIYL